MLDGMVVTHEPSVKGSGGCVSNSTGKKRLVNCIIRNNQTTSSGGGILCFDDLVLDHCTVYQNTARYNGNAISGGGRITLRNSIVWNPVLASDPNLADEELNGSLFEVIHSIVGGGEQGGLNIDPKLTPEGWLKSTSPAINRARVGVLARVDIHGQIRQQPDLGADDFVDSDRDSLPDWWERLFFGDLSKGAGFDGDRDGVSALQEYLAGTNPLMVDTDGDGIPDGR